MKSLTAVAETAPIAPGPRAFHAAWSFQGNVFIHGGEGRATGGLGVAGGLDLDDVVGSVGRDPFAEEDGGAPVEAARIVVAANRNSPAVAPASSVESKANAENRIVADQRAQKMEKTSSLRPTSCDAERQRAVSVLEDLWRFDPSTLRWERVRDASSFFEMSRFSRVHPHEKCHEGGGNALSTLCLQSSLTTVGSVPSLIRKAVE